MTEKSILKHYLYLQTWPGEGGVAIWGISYDVIYRPENPMATWRSNIFTRRIPWPGTITSSHWSLILKNELFSNICSRNFLWSSFFFFGIFFSLADTLEEIDLEVWSKLNPFFSFVRFEKSRRKLSPSLIKWFMCD